MLLKAFGTLAGDPHHTFLTLINIYICLICNTLRLTPFKLLKNSIKFTKKFVFLYGIFASQIYIN